MKALVVALVLLLSSTLAASQWCVCRQDAPQAALQKTIDYACGAGADCNSIHENGPCYNPNSVPAHCSWAANSYYQNNKARHLRLHRHRHPHHQRPKFFWLLLPYKCKRCWNNDPDHWRHNGRNPRNRNLHARCRHHRHWNGNRHYYWDHWHWARSRTCWDRHGHCSGGLAPKGWAGRRPHHAPLRHRIRMTFDPSRQDPTPPTCK